MKVFVLYFVGPTGPNTESWFGKFIGVYTSQREAARAVERQQRRAEFRHYPQGFQVECVHLDEDYDGAVNLGDYGGSGNLGPVPPQPLPPPPPPPS